MRGFLLTLIVVLTLVIAFLLFSPYAIKIGFAPRKPVLPYPPYPTQPHTQPIQPQPEDPNSPQNIQKRNESILHSLNQAERRRENNYPLELNDQLNEVAVRLAEINANGDINAQNPIRPLRVNWANMDTIMFVLSPKFSGQDALYHALEDSRYRNMLTSTHFGYTHMGIGSAVNKDGNVQWAIVVATAWK